MSLCFILLLVTILLESNVDTKNVLYYYSYRFQSPKLKFTEVQLLGKLSFSASVFMTNVATDWWEMLSGCLGINSMQVAPAVLKQVIRSAIHSSDHMITAIYDSFIIQFIQSIDIINRFSEFFHFFHFLRCIPVYFAPNQCKHPHYQEIYIILKFLLKIFWARKYRNDGYICAFSTASFGRR